MEIPEDHKKYLSRKGIKYIKYLSSLSVSVNNILYDYSHWMEALADGVIQPFNAKQREFVKFTQQESTPENEFHTAWDIYNEYRKGSVSNNSEVKDITPFSGGAFIDGSESLDDWWSKER